MQGGRRVVSIVAVTLAAGCDILGLGADRRTLEVAGHKMPCQGLFPTLCLQVREPGEPAFQNLYETPRGFTFEWGYEYVVVVEEERVDPVPADGSSILRLLDRVVSKEPVPPGSTFDWLLDPADGLVAVDDSTFSVYSDQARLSCAPDGTGCAELAAWIAEGGLTSLTLGYPSASGGPLPILGWTPCAERTWPCEPPGGD